MKIVAALVLSAVVTASALVSTQSKAVRVRVQTELGDIVIEVSTREVTIAGKPADLTGIEFDILLALARRPGRVVPRVEPGRARCRIRCR